MEPSEPTSGYASGMELGVAAEQLRMERAKLALRAYLEPFATPVLTRAEVRTIIREALGLPVTEE